MSILLTEDSAKGTKRELLTRVKLIAEVEHSARSEKANIHPKSL